MSQICKILTIVGARPQFIKAAAVSKAFSESDQIRELMVHTGQHFDPQMSDVFFNELSIRKSDYNLGIDSLSHGAMTGRMLEQIEKVIQKENPDYILVYGDTNSTLAGALAAKKLHKKIVHIEAGLRSHDMRMPEEINRILTDRISDILFCPTETAVSNLQKEGFDNFSCKIINSGDVMLDAVLMYREKVKEVKAKPDVPEDFLLCTIHRAENTNDISKLSKIFKALEEINKIVPIALPLHPRTKALLDQYEIESNLMVLEPQGYLEMLYLLDKCKMVLTDSGGLQKEAYFLKKYCLTLRDTTEWSELTEGGYNLLVGSEPEKILKGFHDFLNREFTESKDFYGNGRAGKIITESILEDYRTSF